MITENRVLLIASGEIIEQFSFEAIEYVTDMTQVKNVWKCNKTPIILREFYDNSIINVPTLNVPNELRDSNDFIIFCHGNGFECGELIKGQKFDTTKDDCFLCEIGNHNGSVTEFNRTTENLSDLIIYESDNFFVKIELGCMIPGMVMINPKEHHYSIARIPDDRYEEYYEVMKDIEILLKATFGNKPVIYFEHGSAPTGFSTHAKSIVHAHTHVAIGCPFEKKYLDAVQLKPISNIKSLYKSKYLTYQCGSTGQLLAVNDPKVYVQRQYPRQIIGLMNNIPNELTNWRVEPFTKNMVITFKALLKCLIEKQKELPDTILERTKGFVEGYPQRQDF